MALARWLQVRSRYCRPVSFGSEWAHAVIEEILNAAATPARAAKAIMAMGDATTTAPTVRPMAVIAVAVIVIQAT